MDADSAKRKLDEMALDCPVCSEEIRPPRGAPEPADKSPGLKSEDRIRHANEKHTDEIGRLREIAKI